MEGQVARVADIIAYVNHDIDDSVRAGILTVDGLPAAPVKTLGATSSARIGCMVTDVVLRDARRRARPRVRMSDEVLDATLALRSFLFEAVYENCDRHARSSARRGACSGGLWEKVRERPEEFLDLRTVAGEGLDAAARDFLAGMTDRYAIALFERLFIPKPWVDLQPP